MEGRIYEIVKLFQRERISIYSSWKKIEGSTNNIPRVLFPLKNSFAYGHTAAFGKFSFSVDLYSCGNYSVVFNYQ